MESAIHSRLKGIPALKAMNRPVISRRTYAGFANRSSRNLIVRRTWLCVACGALAARASQIPYEALKPTATIARSTWMNFRNWKSIFPSLGPSRDRDRRAVHTACLTRREEQDHVRHLVRRRPELGIGLRHLRAIHGMVDRRRQDGIHGDPLALHLGGKGL